MQVVKKVFVILFTIWFAFVLFMPKRDLYYKFEHLLAEQGIKINESKIKEGIFTLDIDEAVIYIKGIDLIRIRHISFLSLFFYNRVSCEEVVLDESLKNITPTKLKRAIFSYAIWSPGDVSVLGQGKFGIFEGEIDLIKRRVHLDFKESKELGVLEYQLKEGEKGLYYETSF